MKIKHRKFVFYFYFVGWSAISLGLSVCFRQPNIELHIPFGFIRVGWEGESYYKHNEVPTQIYNKRVFGYQGKRRSKNDD
jgi:hypothetical protein